MNQSASLSLHLAAETGLSRALRNELRKSSRWIDEPDSKGCTPLQLVVAGGHLVAAKVLLEFGAAMDTELHAAAGSGDVHMLVLLLNNSADEQRQDQVGGLAIHDAAAAGQLAAMVLARKSPGSLGTPDSCGRTPLHLWAALPPSSPDLGPLFAERPISHEALGVHDAEGHTALWHAVSNGNQQLAALLLAHGATPRGACLLSSPVWEALRSGDGRLLELLLGGGCLCSGHSSTAHPLSDQEVGEFLAVAMQRYCGLHVGQAIDLLPWSCCWGMAWMSVVRLV